MVLTQTALHKEDPISMAHKDPSWLTVKYPKLYQDVDNKWHSAWPELYPIEGILRKRKPTSSGGRRTSGSGNTSASLSVGERRVRCELASILGCAACGHARLHRD